MQINVLSLFDGISCGRLALQRAGIEVENYFASEIEDKAEKISDKNWPGIIRLGDINNWQQWELPKIDLVIGGSPCQGFSRNGHRLNFEDPRSKLFFEYVEIWKMLKEKNHDIKFFLENVEMKKEWRDAITEYMGVQPRLINSKLVSAQSRPRMYWSDIPWVELPEDKGINLIDILDPEHSEETTEKNGMLFGQGIYEAEKELVSIVDGQVRVKQATKQGYIIAEPGDGVNLSIPTSKTRRGRVIKKKSPTLDTGCNVCIYDGKMIRHPNIKELERLQTLPDGYTDANGVEEKDRKKAIGNGWTADIVTHYMKAYKKWLDTREG